MHNQRLSTYVLSHLPRMRFEPNDTPHSRQSAPCIILSVSFRYYMHNLYSQDSMNQCTTIPKGRLLTAQGGIQVNSMQDTDLTNSMPYQQLYIYIYKVTGNATGVACMACCTCTCSSSIVDSTTYLHVGVHVHTCTCMCIYSNARKCHYIGIHLYTHILYTAYIIAWMHSSSRLDR